MPVMIGRQSDLKHCEVRVDAATHVMSTIEYEHHEIHAGSAYTLSRPVTLPVANDDEIRIAVANTTKWPHMLFSAVSDAAVTVSLYETTGLAHEVGNVLTPINRNRNSTKTSGLTICHTPSGAGDGSLIYASTAGVGGNPAQSAPGAIGGRFEFILKQNTAYLLRVAGASGDVVSINLEWYEHTDKD
jgi:hypothetical protein